MLLSMVGLAIVLIFGIYSWLDKTNGRIEVDGKEREYLLYVPESLDPSVAAPLVVSLHGFSQWPAHQMSTSRWNGVAEKNGFIVVYPSGRGFPKRWSTSLESDTPGDSSSDVQFISDLIDRLVQEYNIDHTRIYVNGFSNGGGMATLLACKLSERIAVVGTVAGAYRFMPTDCEPSRWVPLITFHGNADPIVPFWGGVSHSAEFTLPLIPKWVNEWAMLNKCNLAAAQLPVTDEVSGIRYTQCAQNAEVVFYTIEGGGHAWPGGEPIPRWIVGHTTSDIDASQVMWEFFRIYRLKAD